MNTDLVLRVAIADDEPLARARLRRLLDKAAGTRVEIKYEAADTEALLRAAADNAIDLLFLDIEMPGENGFSALRRWPGVRPHIVFVTAHEQHGVRAFGVRALDYLLKPVSLSRLADTLDRANECLGRCRALARDSKPMISLDLSGRFDRVALESIDQIVAKRNYLELHVGKRRYVIRRALRDFHISLGADDFLRVHRSIVVRRSAVRSVKSAGSGCYDIKLTEGQNLRSGRSYRNVVQKFLLNHLAEG